MLFDMANIKILEIMPQGAKFTNFSLTFKLTAASILYEAHMYGFKKLKNLCQYKKYWKFQLERQKNNFKI